MSDLAYIDTYVDDPNIRRLLQAIRAGEGTADAAGYNRMFGGRQFADLSRHPAQVQRGGGYASDASGAYQFLSTTWGPLAAKYGLSDFSPRNQDRGAVALIREKIPDLGALSQQLQQNGLTPDVLDKLAPVWASLPTKAGKSYYGQPVKSLRELQAAFGQGPSGSSPALQPSLSAGQGDSNWLSSMADELLNGSNVSTPEIEMTPRRRPNSGDWLTEYANANLEQAARQSRQSRRMAGSQGFMQALNSISPFRSGRSRRDMDLMLPEERQESQRAAIEAIQALMGGGGGQQGLVATASKPMSSGGATGGPLRVGRVARPEEDVWPTTGAHLDVRIQNPGGEYINPANAKSILQNLYVGGKPLYQQTASGAFEPSYPVTSPFGPRAAPTAGASTFHRGKDFGVGANTPLEWRGGGSYSFSGGVGVIDLPDGRKVKLLHTRPS